MAAKGPPLRRILAIGLAAGTLGCGGTRDPLRDVPSCRAWLDGATACIQATPLSHRPALEAAVNAVKANVRTAPETADFAAACELAAADLATSARSLCPGVSFSPR